MNKKIVILVGLVLFSQIVFGAKDFRDHNSKLMYSFLLEADTLHRLEMRIEKKAISLDDYEIIADYLDIKWKKLDSESHARLMLDVCSALSAGQFEGTRQYKLVRKYSLSALKNIDEIPILVEMELIEYLGTWSIDKEVSDERKFSQLRKDNLAFRLHAWRRLNEFTSIEWHPDKHPIAGNLVPPVATGLQAGVDPKAIKNPTLRKQYEDAISLSLKKVNAYSEQRRVRSDSKRFESLLEASIINEYSQKPAAFNELETMLNEYIPEHKAKARILEAVSKAK